MWSKTGFRFYCKWKWRISLVLKKKSKSNHFEPKFKFIPQNLSSPNLQKHIHRYNPDASLSYTFVQPQANNRSGTIQQKYRHYTQLLFYFLISCAFVYHEQYTRASEKQGKKGKKKFQFSIEIDMRIQNIF